jgi:hypothetical protein
LENLVQHIDPKDFMVQREPRKKFSLSFPARQGNGGEVPPRPLFERAPPRRRLAREKFKDLARVPGYFPDSAANRVFVSGFGARNSGFRATNSRFDQLGNFGASL